MAFLKKLCIDSCDNILLISHTFHFLFDFLKHLLKLYFIYEIPISEGFAGLISELLVQLNLTHDSLFLSLCALQFVNFISYMFLESIHFSPAALPLLHNPGIAPTAAKKYLLNSAFLSQHLSFVVINLDYWNKHLTRLIAINLSPVQMISYNAVSYFPQLKK